MFQEIPLPRGLTGKFNSYRQRELLINKFYEERPGSVGTLVDRPGVEKIQNGIGFCRGSGLFKEELYQVSSNKLIRITLKPETPVIVNEISEDDVDVEVVGDIGGASGCLLIAGFTKLLIMEIGGGAYVYDGNTLEQITDASYKPSVSAAYIQGKFVFIPADGEPFFWSEIGDPANILPQSYADAEEFPDPNKGCFVINQTLFVCGTRSIEELEFDANLQTFVRIAGRSRNVGYVGGLADYKESFMFVGRGKNGGFAVYDIMDTANPRSNSFVSELLNTQYTLEDLENINAQYFKYDDTDFILFYLPNDTLCYCNGEWSFWREGTKGLDRGTLGYSYIQFAYGRLFTGDINNSNIGILTNTSTDYGLDIEYIIQTYVRFENRGNLVMDRLFLDCTTGQKNRNRSISVAFSEDGQIYGDDHSEYLGDAGDYAAEISWGSPIGTFDNYCGILMKQVGDIEMDIDRMGFM